MMAMQRASLLQAALICMIMLSYIDPAQAIVSTPNEATCLHGSCVSNSALLYQAVLDLTSTAIALIIPIILIARLFTGKAAVPVHNTAHSSTPRHSKELNRASPRHSNEMATLAAHSKVEQVVALERQLTEANIQLQGLLHDPAVQAVLTAQPTQVVALELQLTQANISLQELLHDPAVHAALISQPAVSCLGLDPHRQPEFLPFVSLLQEPLVRAALDHPTQPVDVAAAVAVIRDHLLQHPRLLEHIYNMHVYGMNGHCELYTGRDWTTDIHVKTTSIALLVVAARNSAVRQVLKEQLLPWISQSNYGSWRELNVRGFYQFGTDVLMYCMGEQVVGGYQKCERVAAAMMLGLMFEDEMML